MSHQLAHSWRYIAKKMRERANKRPRKGQGMAKTSPRWPYISQVGTKLGQDEGPKVDPKKRSTVGVPT